MKVSDRSDLTKSLFNKTRYSLLGEHHSRCHDLLTEFQELARAGIYEWDIVHNVFSGSKELFYLFGHTEYIDEGTDLFELVDPSDFSRLKNELHAALESKDRVEFDLKVTNKDHTIRFLGMKGKIYYNKQKAPVRVVGTVFDITERKYVEEEMNNKNIAILNAYKKLENSQEELKKLNNELESRVEERTIALQNSESELRTLSETIPHLVWRADSKGHYDYFNKQWFDYTGSTFEQSKGTGWLDFVHPDDVKKVRSAWKIAIEKGSSYNAEFRIRKYDGHYRWFLSKALPIEANSGHIINWFGTSTDIEDQRQINEKKDEFIGIASHELKTPLTSIKAYIQLLLRNKLAMKDTVSVTYLEKTEEYINKLNSLIADLLDVSKIQAGKLQFNMMEIDFDDLVRECVETMQYITDTHEITIKGKSGKKIIGDKQRLEQVFFNFISNAIKYSPKGERVVITISSTDSEVQVAVTDYGIGIPKEKLDKLFTRFYRVEGLSPTFTGLGIGLFIAGEIIRRHNGKFWVESQEGKGSTFYFSLPIEQH